MKKGNLKERVLCKRKCCRILKAIKTALQSPKLDDASCFQRIEEIVQSFESNGIKISYRYDF